MANFEINLDDKPALSKLMRKDKSAFREIVGTFVSLMEVAAEKNWIDLPKQIHTSLSFEDVVGGTLDAIMSTKDIHPSAYATLESDLHPLALLSDKRKDAVSGDPVEYDWKSHFSLDSNYVSRETLEHIIRKMLYLMRWFDIEQVSKALISNQFPMVDDRDIRKLPFQPALMYQIKHLGELHSGKFLHNIGAFDCGTIDSKEVYCPACKIGHMEDIENYKVCPRCNSGFTLQEEYLEF